MNKKILLSMTILCATLLMGMTASAAVNYVPVNCDQCAAVLNTGSYVVEQYQSTHLVPTNYVDSNGKPVYEVCTVRHVRTSVGKTCPNGHGVKFNGIYHDEYHSVCADKHYYE